MTADLVNTCEILALKGTFCEATTRNFGNISD